MWLLESMNNMRLAVRMASVGQVVTDMRVKVVVAGSVATVGLVSHSYTVDGGCVLLAQSRGCAGGRRPMCGRLTKPGVRQPAVTTKAQERRHETPDYTSTPAAAGDHHDRSGDCRHLSRSGTFWTERQRCRW